MSLNRKREIDREREGVRGQLYNYILQCRFIYNIVYFFDFLY